ncbi:uncharacterized protein EV420DRAFT_1028074 [Desarmillaria tabescens]|uniref:Uncharacterized protein n=1 Tax=Armillaria tabescens TaxID=1929756 RepID=A0AA39MQI7_ARMTA|nr:uncharacterized protein EV420DRAFT_1028074 [Desarmillaria tabescens]KAK0443371.1 hypothetical protein EV420DRAFT_1028074 [Desarmillaria tabescens]
MWSPWPARCHSSGMDLLVIGVRLVTCGSPQQTPNFIMKTTDVVTGTAPDAPRWTLHFFVEPNTPGTLCHNIPPGRALRVPPNERDTWPPQCLFVAVYASALLTTWPAWDLLEQVRTYWSNSFWRRGESQ